MTTWIDAELTVERGAIDKDAPANITRREMVSVLEAIKEAREALVMTQKEPYYACKEKVDSSIATLDNLGSAAFGYCPLFTVYNRKGEQTK